MVPMDAMLIEQVINNLLENAHFHSGSEKPIELKYVQKMKYFILLLKTTEKVLILSGSQPFLMAVA